MPMARLPGSTSVAYLRAWLRRLLFPGTVAGRWARRADAFLACVVVVSLAGLVLGSVREIHDRYAGALRVLDAASAAIFAIEYAARLWACADDPRRGCRGGALAARWRWVRSPTALADLLALLPFLLEALLPVHLDLRALRVYRLLRLFKLGRHAHALTTLRSVVRREADILVTSGIVMVLLVVFTACLVWLCEHDAQPVAFENIPQTIYWAVVTLSSIGYGDIVPVTAPGRLVTVVMSLVGISLFAFPAGVLASGFTDQLHLDREAFAFDAAERVGAARCGPAERARRMAALHVEAARLHLQPDDVERIVRRARHEFAQVRVAERRLRNRTRAPVAGDAGHAAQGLPPVAFSGPLDAEGAFPLIRLRLLALMQLAVMAGAGRGAERRDPVAEGASPVSLGSVAVADRAANDDRGVWEAVRRATMP